MFKYEADCSFKNVTNYELQYLPIQYCLQKSTQDDIDFYISQFGVSDFDLVPSALPSTEVLSEVPPAVVALAEVPVTSMTGVTVNTTAVSLPSSQTPRLIKSKAAYCKLRLPSEEYRAFRLQKRQKNQEKKKQRGKRVRSVLGSSESVQSTNCSFSPRPQKEATATVSVSPFFPAPQHEDRSETNERCTRLSYVSACGTLDLMGVSQTLEVATTQEELLKQIPPGTTVLQQSAPLASSSSSSSSLPSFLSCLSSALTEKIQDNLLDNSNVMLKNFDVRLNNQLTNLRTNLYQIESFASILRRDAVYHPLVSTLDSLTHRMKVQITRLDKIQAIINSY
ncbi:hypothetical protein RN001_001979 [Aquatica leii]|uniref:Uncharacterized protein n=1 Tax=Aquatica leii TaxID=1421715 RepID=A0AAN7QN71_9COLE|nr:hypothetical protein RN001_001979 [Aquatica leii]